MALLAASVPGTAGAIELQQSTLNAWADYVSGADVRLQDRLSRSRSFLWSDESPERKTRLRAGEVVAPLVGHGTQEVPNGLIHDWIGAAFIPNAKISGVMAVLHDYDRYKDVYKPVVADSKVLACSAADDEFSMTWRRRILFVNAAMEGRYRAHDYTVDARRGYTVAETTSIQEIENYGRPGERLVPVEKGNGYIWRLQSIARYEERDGGVYLELQVIALTRDIPSSLQWLVSPVVNHLSINSLSTTLRQTRLAVNALPAGPQRVARCTDPDRRLLIAKRGEE
jgi:hypothetical protein